MLVWQNSKQPTIQIIILHRETYDSDDISLGILRESRFGRGSLLLIISQPSNQPTIRVAQGTAAVHTRHFQSQQHFQVMDLFLHPFVPSLHTERPADHFSPSALWRSGTGGSPLTLKCVVTWLHHIGPGEREEHHFSMFSRRQIPR